MVSESTGLKQLLSLLDSLKATPSGQVVYRHIERILEDTESSYSEKEQAYTGLITLLLESFSRHLSDEEPLKVQIKLVQMRLTPPLSMSDLSALHAYVEAYAEQIAHLPQVNGGLLAEVLSPLFQQFGIAGSDAGQDTGQVLEEQKAEPEIVPDITEQDIESAPVYRHREYEEFTRAQDREHVEQKVDTAYRQHLNEKRQNIQDFQETLANHVTEAIDRTDEFGELLDIVLVELREAENIRDMEVLRKTMIGEIEKISGFRQALSAQLKNAHNSLQVVETGSQQLHEELDRVRVLSLTDELTTLPNRRAFMRRLEDETGRVQRYGNPLTLVLLDLDKFKAINDTHGHGAGDAVMRAYAKSVLSIFRHHDLVGRYGGEEFAVLMPNTDQDGAQAALKKIQRRASEITVQHNGLTLDLPTFSAGLAIYKPGETPSSLIERADNALYKAKDNGRNRVEVAENETQEPHSSGKAGKQVTR